MAYKFEELEVWQRALDDADHIHELAEQDRFLRLAVRSLLETVACLHLIKRREYLNELDPLREAYRESETLFAKLQAFRSPLDTDSSVREPSTEYNDDPPF